MAAKHLTCILLRSFCTFSIFLILICVTKCAENVEPQYSDAELDAGARFPTVLVATLIRNKAHVLPYFFGQLENLDYPKERMAIW